MRVTINRHCLTLWPLLLLVCLSCGATAQDKLTVIVYDVHAHKFVRGVKVEVLPLSIHNGLLSHNLLDPTRNAIDLDLTSTTDSAGRATFEVGELLQVVDLVNKQLADSPRKLITKHYEIGIWPLTRGYYCTYVNQSLHQILNYGVVGDLGNHPCKTDVKPQDFHAKPGEIIMFVTHAM